VGWAWYFDESSFYDPVERVSENSFLILFLEQEKKRRERKRGSGA